MSINFDITLSQIGDNTVKINTSGFEGDTLAEDKARLNIYAYNSNTGHPVFTASLNIDEIRKLYSYLSHFSIVKDGTAHSFNFREMTDELHSLIEQLENVDSSLLKKLLDKMKKDEKISALLLSFSDEELQELEATRKQSLYKLQIQNLQKLIDLEISSPTNFVSEVNKDPAFQLYRSGQPEKIFQNWVEQNLWVFGGEYYKKHDARAIAFNSESDLIIENADNFIDLIELKRPSVPIFKFDSSHNSFYPSTELSKVLGQSLFYLKKLDEYKGILEKEYSIRVLKPRIIIVLGSTSKEFEGEKSELQSETLRMLNSNLNHINIVSYDYLLSMGQKIIDCYSNKEN
jgi:hypothetical protein